MKYLKNIIKSISLFLVFVLLNGNCVNLYGQDMPDWAKKKLLNSQDTLYGIGQAHIGPNVVLAQKKADDAARVDIAQKMTVKVKNVMETFTTESIDLINSDNNSSTELTNDVTKTVTEATLVNCIIIDRYKDEENNIMYSLAMMCKAPVVNQIKDIVSQDTKNYFKEDKKLLALKKLDDNLEKWDLKN